MSGPEVAEGIARSAPQGAGWFDANYAHSRKGDFKGTPHRRSRVREPEYGWVRTHHIHCRSTDTGIFVGARHRRATDLTPTSGTGAASTQAPQASRRDDAPNVSPQMLLAGNDAWRRAFGSKPPYEVNASDLELWANIFKAMYSQMLKDQAK